MCTEPHLFTAAPPTSALAALSSLYPSVLMGIYTVVPRVHCENKVHQSARIVGRK